MRLFPEDDIAPAGRCEIFPIEIFQRDENFPTGRIFSSRIFLEKVEYFIQKYFSPLEIFHSNGEVFYEQITKIKTITINYSSDDA